LFRLQTNLLFVQAGKVFQRKSTKEAFFEGVFYQVPETEPKTFPQMGTPRTPKPVPGGGTTETPTATEPTKRKGERLVDTSQIGLHVVYEPIKALGSRTDRIDAEYAISFPHSLSMSNALGNRFVSSVICVHGLGADPDWSWRDKSSEVSWIEHPEMLPAAIPNARILRYGWWTQDSAVKSRVPDLAVELLHDLKNEPDRRVFVPSRCERGNPS
jgi:hypothetical protein